MAHRWGPAVEALRLDGDHHAALFAIAAGAADAQEPPDPPSDQPPPYPPSPTTLPPLIDYLCLLGADASEPLLRYSAYVAAHSPSALVRILTEVRPHAVQPLPALQLIDFVSVHAPAYVDAVAERLHHNLQRGRAKRGSGGGGGGVAGSGGDSGVDGGARRGQARAEAEAEAAKEAWRQSEQADVAAALVSRYSARLRELQLGDGGDGGGDSNGGGGDGGSGGGGDGSGGGGGGGGSSSESSTLLRKLDELLATCDIVSARQSQAMLDALQPPPSPAGLPTPLPQGGAVEEAASASVSASAISSASTRAASVGWLARQREVLLSRLGRHEEALLLLGRQLEDHERAISYCGSEPQLLMCLLRVYLQPTPPDPPLLPPALRLLTTHADKLHLREAIGMLPPEPPLAEVAPAVVAILSRVQQSRRQAQVLCSLHKARSVQLHSALLEARARRVVVDESTLCEACGKRIGTFAFGCLPTGELLHVACKLQGAVPSR